MNQLLSNVQRAAAAWRKRFGMGWKTAPLLPDESFFEYLVQHANSIILVSEMHTSKILFANRFALDFFGYTEKELVGKPALGTIIPPEESSGRNLEGMIAGLYRDPEMYFANENENLRKNGEPVWVAWTNRALLNSEGEFIGMLSIGNDITERKAAEQKLSRSEEYYRAVFDLANAAIIVTDLEGNILDVNATASKMYGYTREELLALPPTDLITEEFARSRPDRLAMISRGLSQYEMIGLRKDGSTFPVENFSSIIDYEGAKAILVLQRDITDKKQAEEQLRLSESYYRMIFENSSDPIFLLDETGAILDINAAALETYGYSYEELVGSDATFLVDPEHVSLTQERRSNVLDQGYLAYENVHIAKDGRRLFLDVRASRVTFEGRPVLLIVAHDVTEKRERARQLSEFLSIASHELSLPVTIIKGYTQTLGRHLGDLSADALAQVLDSIDGSANRLSNLVEELLDVTRIETGRLVLNRDTIELEPLLLDTAKEMQFKADEHAFDIRLVPGAERVRGDSSRIAQVLMILLDNASRFSPPESLIEVEAAPTVSGDGGVLISVLDRGIGVTESDCTMIFEPFSQVEDVEHHGNSGLGMGLYIAREIVKGHGGDIWCEGRPGGGSAFRFSIPAG